jgi:nitrogen regulatory protein PII
MENNSDMKMLIIVVNAGFSENVIEIARNEGVRGATLLNARGEGARHESFLGITVDTEKEMILCVTEEDTAEKAMAAIKEKAGIKTPAHSICFTVPVEKTVGINIPE